MPTLMSSLPEYAFSEAELREAQILRPDQVLYFQTLLAQVVYRRSNVELDPNNISAFIQAEAYYKAQRDIYQGILDEHERAQAALLEINSRGGDFLLDE